MSTVWRFLDRLGRALDRRRVLHYSAMLLTVEIALSGFIVAGTYGLLNFSGDTITTDFVSFYAAGTLADDGTPALAYHPGDLFLAEQQARNPGIEYNYFYYPPVFLLLCALLARLPYITAFFVFEGLTLGLYLLVMTKILDDVSWASLAATLAFPIVFWNFGWGQNGFLTAALIGAGALFVDRRPILAGLLFGAVCYKPHFGLLIPIALAAGRHWRAFFAAAASATALAALSLILFGAATWRDFLTTALASPATYAAGKVKFSAFVTPFGGTMLLGGTLRTAYVIQGIAIVVAIALVAVAWYRNLTLPVRAATLASATLIAAPVALLYDLLLATVAAAWLCRCKEKLSGAERLVLVVCYLLLLGSDQVAQFLRLPVALAGALAIVIIAARHALYEARAVSAM